MDLTQSVAIILIGILSLRLSHVWNSTNFVKSLGYPSPVRYRPKFEETVIKRRPETSKTGYVQVQT